MANNPFKKGFFKLVGVNQLTATEIQLLKDKSDKIISSKLNKYKLIKGEGQSSSFFVIMR